METKEELVRATVRELTRFARKYSATEDLPVRVDALREVSTREAHAIQAIAESEAMNVTRLAETFGVTTSAASQMATKLTSAGYIAKKAAPHSRKEVALSLTPLGRAAYQAHERAHGRDMSLLVERLSAFSLSQIATISVVLEAMGSVLDERLSGEAVPKDSEPE